MARKKRHRDERHTPLNSHSKKGSTLVPPLGELNVNLLDFERDLLPEHLWIAALAEHFGIRHAHKPFERFLDAIDEFWTDEKQPCLGLISDFGRLSPQMRSQFIEIHRIEVCELFHEPIGRVLAFYPECPAYWLVDNKTIEERGSLDPEVELQYLRKLVRALLPAKDWYAGHLRMLPFGRLLKHGKIFFAQGIETVDLLPKYPTGLSEKEQFRVQQFVRTSMTSMYLGTKHYPSADWPKYFWRHNYDLAVCRPAVLPLKGARVVRPQEGETLERALDESAAIAREYLDQLTMKVRLDLYDPTRDEVLFGLFARLSRLFILIASDSNLWARDMGGIMLRCLADTAITFSYLAVAATEEDFRRFREYGEGQEKLLMLHLQDNYPDSQSLEGRSSDAIASNLGSFIPEVLNIELGHWAKKDTRRLATDAGLEWLYRLVYTPTSSDLHGTWLSLKHSNFCRCLEVLHRFHRLPTYTEPPVFVNIVATTQELYRHCVDIGVQKLGYPSPQRELPPLTTADKSEEST
jgi:hypothetical protein